MTAPDIDERLALRELLRQAYRELNAIRAETGAPLGYDGMTRCTYEHWHNLVEDCRSALGDDAKPWETAAAKTLRERTEKYAEQRSADEVASLREQLTDAEARAVEAERQRDEARAAALEEAAGEADAYAAVNLQMAGDTILHDPVLSGRDRSEQGFERSAEMRVDGTIHSAAYHAATNIAGRIRALSALPPATSAEG